LAGVQDADVQLKDGMNRAHFPNGAPAAGTPAVFIARSDRRETEFRVEQEAFPSAGTCPDKVDRDWDR